MLVCVMVSMPPVVVALSVVVDVSEVVGGVGEVEGHVVGPELGFFPTPSHRLQHLVSVDVADHRHLFQLQVHFHCINSCHADHVEEKEEKKEMIVSVCVLYMLVGF